MRKHKIMEVKSIQKYVLTSPKKLREVVSMIKNLNPNEAVERLPFSGRRASLPLKKVIASAIANAKQKNISPTELIFKEIQINDAPRLKRWRAGARGRAKPYKRRMSHIRVVLTTKEKEPVKRIESKTKKISTEADKSKVNSSVRFRIDAEQSRSIKNQKSKLQIKDKNEKK